MCPFRLMELVGRGMFKMSRPPTSYCQQSRLLTVYLSSFSSTFPKSGAELGIHGSRRGWFRAEVFGPGLGEAALGALGAKAGADVDLVHRGSAGAEHVRCDPHFTASLSGFIGSTQRFADEGLLSRDRQSGQIGESGLGP